MLEAKFSAFLVGVDGIICIENAICSKRYCSGRESMMRAAESMAESKKTADGLEEIR